ncbi:MAG: 16S rRNA (guanine(966)-N(2))-methyltransferase RsmD [Planctomycetes bacterium RBG_13_62_9]|nr:MAG: 16S rRNA (guanine(966)-N(2))-methyltransferase RsmD [Planctomycetes bacterium RBG_13_62_9]
MRIIAGTKRGMKLFSPETDVTRPITDRVKESLFNVLQNYDLLAGARVADLFCGVGSLGLEALSRGAASATFVEKNTEVIAVLEKNIAKAGFAGQSRVVRASAFGVGAPVDSGGERYDLVFVDPPYAVTGEVGEHSSLAELLRILQDQVVARGVVVVRTHRRVAPLEDYGPFHAVDRRQWGTMSIVLLQAKADEQQTNGH